MAPKTNPLDRATVADWRAWITANAKWLIVVAGLFGYNVLQPEPELPPVVAQPDVAFTAMEFQQLITGFQTACQTEVDKWRPKKRSGRK